MIEAAGTLLAGQPAGIGVDPEFQSFAVDIIRERPDPGRKFDWIRDNISLRVTADLPAVVDVYVLVASCMHASADHRIRGFADQWFAYVACKLVPAVPAHGWRCRQLRG